MKTGLVIATAVCLLIVMAFLKEDVEAGAHF